MFRLSVSFKIDLANLKVTRLFFGFEKKMWLEIGFSKKIKLRPLKHYEQQFIIIFKKKKFESNVFSVLPNQVTFDISRSLFSVWRLFFYPSIWSFDENDCEGGEVLKTWRYGSMLQVWPAM